MAAEEPGREAREHELKCWPGPFQDVLDGRKPFEFRVNDRGFAVGDRLRLKEWEPDLRRYTGREMQLVVTYFFDGFGLRASGWCIMAIAAALAPGRAETLDHLAANRLADEVAVLVRRGIIDSRSPAADALLDYRDPPSTPRADRLAELEALAPGRAEGPEVRRTLEGEVMSGEDDMPFSSSPTMTIRIEEYQALHTLYAACARTRRRLNDARADAMDWLAAYYDAAQREV